jgi:hypothetical protein
LRAAKSVKRDTVQFVFGTRSNPPPPPHTFLILKLFIRCLLVGVREGLWVGISLSYKWKQIGVFFRRIVSSMSMNFLAPETSHIMALKIKDYIISSLSLAHHYLRLIIIVSVGGLLSVGGRHHPEGA